MLEKLFRLRENKTTVRTEVVAEVHKEKHSRPANQHFKFFTDCR